MNRIKKIIQELGITNYSTNNGLVDVKGDVILKKSVSIKKARVILVNFGKIDGSFDCSSLLLKSLKGAPHTVVNFNCSYNNLSTLLYSPKIVSGDYICHSNKNLSLKGAPEKVGNNFDASNCGLGNLYGVPKFIGGNAVFTDNFIETTKGLKIVKGNLYISNNRLITIGDIEIGGNIDHTNNPMSPDDELERNWW